MEQQDFSRPKTPLEFLRLFLTGFAMGSADIVPGVSGGTVAFISGIYQTLLNAIKSFNLDAVRLALKFDLKGLLTQIPFGFLIALGLGILTAVFTLAGLLEHWLETAPTYVFAFFAGLIVASVVAVGAKVKWTPVTLVALVIGAVGAFWLVGLDALDPANVSHELPVLFVSGMIAITAMILPGISGSFMLLIMGQYQYVLNAVTERNIVVLGVVAAGCVVGIVGFSRVLSYLLKHYHHTTVAVLVGFMIGSLRTIWERAAAGTSLMPTFGAAELVIVVGLVAAGFVLVSVVDHIATGENPLLRRVWKLDTRVAKQSAA